MTGYEKYLKSINNKNPMSESQWREAVGLKDEEEEHVPIMQVRPKKQAINKSLTYELDQKATQPKKRKAPTSEQRKIKNQKKSEKRKEARRLNPNFKHRADLSNMTTEEVKAHRSRLQKERMEKKRAEGWKEPPRTELQREQRKEYFRRYHQVKKSDPKYMAKKSEIQKRHYYSKKLKINESENININSAR